MPTLNIDFETRSRADLPKVGSYRYAQDPSTEALCLAIRFDRADEVLLWHPAFPTSGLPEEGRDALEEMAARIREGWEVHAFNAMFERSVWELVMRRRIPSLPEVPYLSWRCSAALAASYALPRRLEDIAAALGLPIEKDMVGNRLMKKMSKPRKPTRKDPEGGWHENAEDLRRLFSYCQQDVRVECAVAEQLRPLTDAELEIWRLDQEINLRGVYIDRPMVEQALVHADACRGIANDRVRQLTRGVVPSTTKREDLLTWVRDDCGVQLADTKKGTLDAILGGSEDEAEFDAEVAAEGAVIMTTLPEYVREVLEIWRTTNRSSTKKYQAMLRRVCLDGRIRDLLRYWGASTGRWAGQGIQPQNFPRGGLKKTMEEACRDIATRSREDLELLWGDVMGLLADALRGAICASPGCELLVADYAAIEARGTFWLAGQDEALEILASGKCIYKDMAGRIYDDPNPQAMDKEDPRRQLGKQAILGLGYTMGGPKFQTTCANARIDVTREFAVSVVKLYRDAYPKVVQLWYDTEALAIEAIRSGPGAEPMPGPRGTMWAVRGRFLHCRLPSGRLLSYYKPWITVEPFIWTDPITGEKKDMGPRPKIKFMGVDTYTKKWSRQSTYGGKLVENMVQALSRDLMAEGMLRLEAAGYPVILTVHDETVSEVARGYGSNEEYGRLVAALPAWAAGLPVEAEVWRATRYRK